MRTTICLVFCMTFIALTLESTETLSFTGVATSLSTGKPVYTEELTIIEADGKMVEARLIYRDLEQRPMAQLIALGSGKRYAPAFTMEHFQRETLEGIEVRGEDIIAWTNSSGSERSEVNLTFSEQLASGPGIHYFLQDASQTMGVDDTLEIDILMPRRAQAYTFEISLWKPTDDHFVYLELAPESFLLSIVIGNVRLIYEKGTGRIREYAGVSNVMRNMFSPKTVHISYSYDDDTASTERPSETLISELLDPYVQPLLQWDIEEAQSGP